MKIPRLTPPVLAAKHEAFQQQCGCTGDELGLDTNLMMAWEPVFRFFYEGYFDVKVVGWENIPQDGPVILIGNHSGGLPVDAFMLANGFINHHSSPRPARALAHAWLRRTGFLNRLIAGLGAVPATLDVAVNLLNHNRVVVFYPEGVKGTGKPYALRYRLEDFDPGFVKAAILTGAPIVPVTTVGGDDIYPILYDVRSLARLLKMPYFPITPTFPWLPIFSSCIPLPAKMLIKIGKPITLPYPPQEANNRKLRLHIAREFQYQIQRDINMILSKRKSVFGGWEESFIEELSKSA